LSIPLGKLGYLVPRTFSRSFSGANGDDEEDHPPFRLSRNTMLPFVRTSRSMRSQSQPVTPDVGSRGESRVQSRDQSQQPAGPRKVYRIGGSIIPTTDPPHSPGLTTSALPAGQTPVRDAGDITTPELESGGDVINEQQQLDAQPQTAAITQGNRAIRFPDEAPARDS
jgi:hypothetical protein